MELILPRIFDAHVHFRSALDIMTTVVRHAAAICGDVLVMPNLKPLPDFPGPIETGEQAMMYKQRISDRLIGHNIGTFRPRMTIQVRSTTTPVIIREARRLGVVAGKIYPAGVTTNSESGVTCYEELYPVFEEMQEVGMILSLHGEVPSNEVCPMDREKEFLKILEQIAKQFPDLKIVLEHISTADAVAAVESLSANVGATITPQHMAFNSVDLMGYGHLKTHLFCMPVLKAPHHMKAVRRFATSGSSKAFFGSDSAPHEKSTKEAATCCAGCYSTPVMVPIVTKIFVEEGAVDRLPAFLGERGRAFYGIQTPADAIKIVDQSWIVPESYGYPQIVPICAAQPMHYRVLPA